MRACWWSALALLPAAALVPGPANVRPPSRRRATPPARAARWQPPKQKKRRWTPPSKRGDKGAAPPVADAAADLAREAAGVAAGAVVADPRASLVALPRGATGVEWGTDLSFVGVYVRAVLPGGAAEASGAIEAGDQLAVRAGLCTGSPTGVE